MRSLGVKGFLLKGGLTRLSQRDSLDSPLHSTSRISAPTLLVTGVTLHTQP